MGFGKRRNLTAIMAVLALTVSVFAASSASASEHCHPAGSTGLSAHYVNELPDGPLDVTCDIGIYFDEDGLVNNVDIYGTVTGAKPEQFGIYVGGANVDVTNSSITVDDDYLGEFVSVTYQDGATGTVRKNGMSGAHRVGVLIRGEDTEVDLRGNLVAGTGAKTSGWAENGVQVDQGATSDIIGNTVESHWWDGESNFASSGIMSFTSDGRISNNTLIDNEFSIYSAGTGNRITGNEISSTVISQSSLEFMAYGALIAGDNNHLAGNRISSSNGAVGIYVLPGSAGNRLNGNRITGFDFPIYDGGDNTKARGNPLVTDEGIDVYTHPVH